jgi:hypothetical protein
VVQTWINCSRISLFDWLRASAALAQTPHPDDVKKHRLPQGMESGIRLYRNGCYNALIAVVSRASSPISWG